MGQFFKFLFASCLGVILAMLVVGGIGLIVVTSFASSADKPPKIRPNTVIKLTFDQPIPDRTNNVQYTGFDPNASEVVGLQDMLRLIEHAKDDDNIKGIYIESTGMASTGWASANALHDALADFKDSGKFIVSYSDYYTQGVYYMSSTADQIIANPFGIIDFRGIAAQVPFFKEMLDKIGVDMQVLYAGKFKSATEPYRRTDMSEENKLQVREYLTAIYDTFLSNINETRDIPVAELHRIADEFAAFQPSDAVELGIIDAAGYQEDAVKFMREKMGLDDDEEVRMISIEKYFASKPFEEDFSIKDKIAIVYAEGTIIDGKGEYGSVGSKRYTDILQDIRDNDRVKAVVLRVNSPGGSTTASERLLHQVNLLKDAGKPVIVSMGDYAASGGYFISCTADTILAEPNTLTGSIGVFIAFPSVQELLNDKIGITFDTVKTGAYAAGLNPVFDLSEAEKRKLQAKADTEYEAFLNRVAEGRGMTRDQVHEIAQGRVWTGAKAKELGLVDEVGDLEKSLEIAANMAGLEQYRILEYPRTKDPFQQLIESFMEDNEFNVSNEQILRMKLGDWYPHYKMLKEMHDAQGGVQARLPFVIPFE